MQAVAERFEKLDQNSTSGLRLWRCEKYEMLGARVRQGLDSEICAES